MPQSATPAFRFAVPAPLPLEASFDGGRLTSDGGLPWLEQAETALGLCAAFAAGDSRLAAWSGPPSAADPGPPAGLPDRLRLRGPGRRRHPAHRSAAQAGLWPAAGDRGRPGQPADAVAAGERGRARRPATGWPWRWASSTCASGSGMACRRHIVLDLDGTDDPTHGQQEGSAYHGYYRQHMYHPLLVFDGETDQLITAVLRPGNAHGSTGVVAVLKRVVRALRARWPGVAIEVRLDSGGAVPAIYDCCEQAADRLHHRPDPQPPPGRAGRAAGRRRPSGSGRRPARRRSGCSARSPTRPRAGRTRGGS